MIYICSAPFPRTNIGDSDIENKEDFCWGTQVKAASYIFLSQHTSLIKWRCKLSHFCDDAWLGYQVMDHIPQLKHDPTPPFGSMEKMEIQRFIEWFRLKIT